MSEDAPKVDPKYYKAPGALPKLAPAALKAFQGLLWVGIILGAAGAIVALVVTIGAGVSLLSLAVPFFVGAGIVAGLGKREGE